MSKALRRSLAAVLPVAVLACGPESVTNVSPLLIANEDVTTQLALETLVVCKEGSDATFSVTDNTGGATLPQGTQFSLVDGACVVAATGLGTSITVTELPSPDYTLENVHLTSQIALTVVESDSAGPSLTVRIGNDQGHEMTFFNVPTPPPSGGEGCTPGYWKQRHHFDSWVGYAPGDRFGDIFDSSPLDDLTLLQVLKQGGGGIKALGRHTVAALLNSSNNGVASGLSSSAVIAAFNDAVASGDLETQKDLFAELNEQGCPLN